VAEVNRANCFT